MAGRSLIVIISLALAGTWAGCGSPWIKLADRAASAGPRPAHYGISLPYPIAARPWTGDTSQVSGAERLIPVLISVDQRGRVNRVVPESPKDRTEVAFYTPYLSSFKYEPGRQSDTAAAMTLRILMQIGNVGAKPILHFPVGPRRELDKSETYWAAFEVLGVKRARLRSFLSYNYDIDPTATWHRYEYKIYRVDLDTLGDVTAVEPVRASTPQFTEQIRTAINWGEYVPMHIDSRPVPSTNYIVVALLPNADYPTRPVSTDLLDSLPIWDGLRVRLLPDTVGELMPPIPKREWSGPIEDSVCRMNLSETVTSRIAVDTSGAGKISQISNESWKIRRVLIGLSHDRRFFPALDFSGSPRPWHDLAALRYRSLDTIQVWFNWGELNWPATPRHDTILP